MKSGVRLFVGISAALVAGCNEGGDTNAAGAANASANSVAAKPKHPSYCFFKDLETKSWSAARDAQGNVTVKGKAHIEDTRYTAQLAAPEVSGSSATLWLTMGPTRVLMGRSTIGGTSRRRCRKAVEWMWSPSCAGRRRSRS